MGLPKLRLKCYVCGHNESILCALILSDQSLTAYVEVTLYTDYNIS